MTIRRDEERTVMATSRGYFYIIKQCLYATPLTAFLGERFGRMVPEKS